ncbi:MAG: hypothetical protein PHW04_09475 [Candidatus Wallbacteria bacterium]|nr:hypothetical protein [Candidatus Wallbacteria bacterium]
MKQITMLLFLVGFLFALQAESPRNFLLKVSVNFLQPDLFRPWDAGNLGERSGYAVAVSENRFLVPADLIWRATNITVSTVSSDMVPAVVQHADYDAGLAILSAKYPEKLKDVHSIKLCSVYSSGEKASLHLIRDSVKLAEEAIVTSLFLRRSNFSSNCYLDVIARGLTDFAWGIPLTNDSGLIGICNSRNEKQDKLYFISPEVINHYLHDFDDGRYDGFPCNCLFYRELKGDILPAYLKYDKTAVGKGRFNTGVALFNLDRTPYSQYFRNFDIVTSASGAPVDCAGNVTLADFKGRRDLKIMFKSIPDSRNLDFRGLINTFYYPGETFETTVYRDSRETVVDLKLAGYKPEDFTVPEVFLKEIKPRFILYGGMVFSELSVSFLRSWPNYLEKAPVRLIKLSTDFEDRISRDHEKIVLIVNFLPDKVNYDYEDRVVFQTVKAINQCRISRLSDVKTAFSAEVETDVVEFEDSAFKAVFKHSEMKEANQRIAKQYKLKETERL